MHSRNGRVARLAKAALEDWARDGRFFNVVGSCSAVQPSAPPSTSSVSTEVPSAVTSKSSANQPGASNPASVAYRSRRPMLLPAYGVRST